MKKWSLFIRLLLTLLVIGVVAIIIEFTYYSLPVEEKEEVPYYPAHLDCGY